MKRFLIFIVILLSTVISKAQGYQHAIGLRGGLSSGFEYRFYTDDENSYKLLLSTRDRGYLAGVYNCMR